MLKRKRKSRSIKDREAAFNAGSMLLGALLLLIVTALALDWVLRPDKFPVENVHFEGPFQRVTKEQLIEAVRDQVNRNFFALDLGAVKQRLESLPWVYRASVRRRWPRALHIRFSEQQLVARWGEHDWVNHAGELVPGTGTDALELELPRLYGPAGTHAYVLARYHDFGGALEPSGLNAAELRLTSRRTWQLRLENGLSLVLTRDDPAHRLARFARVYRRMLAPHAGDIRRVDLRYTNGLAVEWLDSSALP